MASLIQYLTLLISATLITAWPQYIDQVPNALSIPWTIAIGHYCVNGGGPLTPFGWDYAHNNHKWNLCLACADSDNDGYPNGWELGDPCGSWVPHSGQACWHTDISHPGNASSVPLDHPINWETACGFNPCQQDEIVQCVSHLNAQRPKIGIPMNFHPLSSSSSSSNTNTNTILRGKTTNVKNIHTHTKLHNISDSTIQEIKDQQNTLFSTSNFDPPPQPNKCSKYYPPKPSNKP